MLGVRMAINCWAYINYWASVVKYNIHHLFVLIASIFTWEDILQMCFVVLIFKKEQVKNQGSHSQLWHKQASHRE